MEQLWNKYGTDGPQNVIHTHQQNLIHVPHKFKGITESPLAAFTEAAIYIYIYLHIYAGSWYHIHLTGHPLSGLADRFSTLGSGCALDRSSKANSHCGARSVRARVSPRPGGRHETVNRHRFWPVFATKRTARPVHCIGICFASVPQTSRLIDLGGLPPSKPTRRGTTAPQPSASPSTKPYR